MFQIRRTSFATTTLKRPTSVIPTTSVAETSSKGATHRYHSFEECSNSSAIGDPDLASNEEGTHLFELIGEELAALLKDVHEQNR